MATLLFYFFFFFFAFAGAENCDSPPDGLPPSTLPLMNINSPCSPFRSKTPLSWSDAVLQMQSNDNARLTHFSSLAVARGGKSTVIPIASGKTITHNPTYIVKVRIGTPPQTLLMAIDTSKDASLVPCTGCVGCSSVSPAYNPSKSKTFKTVKCSSSQCLKVPTSYPTCGSGPRNAPCVFTTSYGASAALVQDNIGLGADSIAGYTFGCINNSTGSSIPAQGMLGLGRQSLSLTSQTYKLYKSTFSYCLPSYNSPKFSGSLRLGTDNQPKNIKTTPLLVNARLNFFYYVNLTGIMVDNKLLNIPHTAFAFNQDTGAGTVFDSGTVYSVLVEPAYTALRNEIRRKMGKAVVFSLGGFDTCYNIPVSVRDITLRFSGMDLRLPQENFLIHSSSGSTSCLAMSAAAKTRIDSGINVIGSFQQQNHRVLIDIPNSKLGVAREPCS